MKIDLSKFKKMHEDKSIVTLVHPHGHKVTLPKAIMSPDMRGKLAKLETYADGGQVQQSNQQPQIDPNEAKKFQQGFNGSFGIQQSQPQQPQNQTKKPEKPKMYADGGSVDDSSDNNATDAQSGKPINININTSPNQSEQTPPTQPYFGVGNLPSHPNDPGVMEGIHHFFTQTPIGQYLMGQPLGSTQPNTLASATERAAQASAPTNVQQPDTTAGAPGLPNQPQMVQPTGSPQPTQPGNSDPFGMDAYERSYLNGLNQQKAGLNKEAQVAQTLGDAQADAQHNQMVQMYKLQSQYQQHLDDLNNEYHAFQQDIQQTKIDPHRYLGNMSTGGKIATAIGLVLGGIGGGLTHQENPAMKVLNNLIDNDIKAQEQNLGTKKTLLEANLRQYGNLNAAQEATRLNMLSIAKAQLDEAAAKASGPLAMAKIQQAKGALDMQAAPLMQSLAMRKALLGGGNGQQFTPDQLLNYYRMTNPEMAKSIESRYIPGVGIGSVPFNDKAREEAQIRNELDQKLAKLEAFAKKNSGSVNPTIIKEGRALAQDAQDTYRRANGQGVFREAESKFVNNMVNQDPAQFFNKFRSLPGYRVVREGNRTALNNLLKMHGINRPDIQFVPAGK